MSETFERRNVDVNNRLRSHENSAQLSHGAPVNGGLPNPALPIVASEGVRERGSDHHHMPEPVAAPQQPVVHDTSHCIAGNSIAQQHRARDDGPPAPSPGVLAPRVDHYVTYSNPFDLAKWALGKKPPPSLTPFNGKREQFLVFHDRIRDFCWAVHPGWKHLLDYVKNMKDSRYTFDIMAKDAWRGLSVHIGPGRHLHGRPSSPGRYGPHRG